MEKMTLPTKQQVITETVELLGLPPISVGAGSSIPSVFFTSIAQEMGIPVRGSMPSLAREIIERSQLTWHPEFSSEDSPSGGGSTVTVLGLLQIKNAVLTWNSQPTIPIPDEYLTRDWIPPKDWSTIRDALPRENVEVLVRPGASVFRSAVLNAYENRCAVSGFNVEKVIEIAHIVPYFGVKSDVPANAIPLRVDLHRLFDAGLLRILPDSQKRGFVVRIHDDIFDNYEQLNDVSLELPRDRSLWPSESALAIKNEMHKHLWQEI
jgi:hypothetical protein